MSIRSEMRLMTAHFWGCVNIRTSGGTGTAFLQGDDRGSVLLTAAHVVQGVQSDESINIRRTSPLDWMPLKVSALSRHTGGADLAAITLERVVWARPPLDTRPITMQPSAEVKFLGFPHGLENIMPTANDFSAPLVRTAFLSGMIKVKQQFLTVLDGFNNPGYSGGPVYWSQSDGAPSLVGVISSYRHEVGPAAKVFERDSEGNEKEASNLYLKPNSGMIYVTPKNYIDELMAGVTDFMPLA